MFPGRSPRRLPRKVRRSFRRTRLQLETLETRLAPATLTVLNTNDSGPGSLRQAILDANSTGGDNTVNFAAAVTGTVDLQTALPDLTSNIDLEGPGADKLTVHRSSAAGTPQFHIFNIPQATVTIAGLTLANAFFDGFDYDRGSGGAIFNSGTLTVTDSIFTGNTTGWSGGGIFNKWSLVVTNSTFVDNNSTSGGAITNAYGVSIATVSNCTFIGNSAKWGGGAIYNAATLTIDHDTFSGNNTQQDGGAIYSDAGKLTVSNSVFTANSAGLDGGGIYAGYFLLEITQSTIRDNSASRSGGAIAVAGYGGSIIDSTISGNSAGENGGGISNDTGGYILDLTNSTVTRNVCHGSGGGIYSRGSSRAIIQNATIAQNTVISDSTGGGHGGGIETAGALDLGNSIVAENSAPVAPDVGADLSRTTGLSSVGLSRVGHNLIGDGSGATGFDRTDLVGTSLSPIDPKLGPLQDNGGPTFTEALLPGSPAIDTGDGTEPYLPTYDQRGNPFARVSGRSVDIGAFEVQQPPSADLDLAMSVLPGLQQFVGRLVTYTLTVLNNGPDPATGVQLMDALPAGIRFIGATMTQGTFTEVDGTVNFQLGSLAVGSAASMTVVVAPAVAGDVTNTASVRASEDDPSLANNTATVRIFVEPSADLALTPAAAIDRGVAGEILTFTLTARNNGPYPATNVRVTDILPVGVHFVLAAASQGTFTQQQRVLTFQLGDLSVGSSAVVAVVLVPTQAVAITNVSTIQGNEPDPNLANDTVIQSIPIGSPSDPLTAFVIALYRDVLDRAPDAAGLGAWVQALYRGTPTTTVVRGFWESPERRGLQIDQLYATYLHRAADSAGRAGWVQALMLGMSEADVTRQFLLSQEYSATHTTAADFVNGLYADLFNRAGDANGAALWQGVLVAGVSKDLVVRAFLDSDEAYIDTVDRYYLSYLHQRPSPALERGWVTQLRSHFIGTDQLAEALLLSDT
jgi:uncharacterized repeat protein (TIGR01451 family)